MRKRVTAKPLIAPTIKPAVKPIATTRMIRRVSSIVPSRREKVQPTKTTLRLATPVTDRSNMPPISSIAIGITTSMSGATCERKMGKCVGPRNPFAPPARTSKVKTTSTSSNCTSRCPSRAPQPRRSFRPIVRWLDFVNDGCH